MFLYQTPAISGLVAIRGGTSLSPDSAPQLCSAHHPPPPSRWSGQKNHPSSQSQKWGTQTQSRGRGGRSDITIQKKPIRVVAGEVPPLLPNHHLSHWQFRTVFIHVGVFYFPGECLPFLRGLTLGVFLLRCLPALCGCVSLSRCRRRVKLTWAWSGQSDGQRNRNYKRHLTCPFLISFIYFFVALNISSFYRPTKVLKGAWSFF